jgi:hypothetical protein
MFVLAVMLLLMAISVSVLTAATASQGFFRSQMELNEVRLIKESVHQSIMFSLQDNALCIAHPACGDACNQCLASLGNQLLILMYNMEDPLWRGGVAVDNTFSPPTGSRIEEIFLDPFIAAASGVDLTPILSIRLVFDVIDVGINFDPNVNQGTQAYRMAGNESLIHLERWVLDKRREPKVANVSATLIVEVTAHFNGRELTSRARYDFSGGVLSDHIEQCLGITIIQPPSPTAFPGHTCNPFNEPTHWCSIVRSICVNNCNPCEFDEALNSFWCTRPNSNNVCSNSCRDNSCRHDTLTGEVFRMRIEQPGNWVLSTYDRN